MSVIDLKSMGTSESPNFKAILFNIEQINEYATKISDINNIFDANKNITEEWNFQVDPKFGTHTGFLKVASGIVSYETLADVALSNSYNDLDDLPSLFSGDYADLSGTPTIPSSLSDLSSPTGDFDFNNKKLLNLSNVVIGSNTLSSSYSLQINNCNYIVDMLGSGKSSIKLMGSYTADYFNTIDAYYHTSASTPSGRVGFQFTGGGSFFVVATSNNYGIDPTHFNFASGYFPTEALNGIKVAEALLFTTNNIGSIGTATIAPSNIYSVNAVTVTSDNDFKKDIEKNIPLGLDFVKKVAENAIATYRWKDTIIEEKKITELKKEVKINKETNKEEINYFTETKILEEEKKEIHTRKHFGFLGVELYNSIIESGLDTKDCAFLSIDDPKQKTKITINAVTGEKIEEKAKDFEVKIKDSRPSGKITIKPTEMLPILFKAIAELSEKNELLEQRILLLEQKGN